MFEQEVLRAKRPVLVDFWAPWCGPCHAITPVLQSLEDEVGDRVSFTKVNVDENPVAASPYGVLSMTVILFDGGEPKARCSEPAHARTTNRRYREVLPASELDVNAVAE